MNDHMIMNPDPRDVPFGRYLKAIRVQQGISLEEVVYETRISLRKLMLIEDEDHDQLPEADQVKALLRVYAEWIGVDEDDIVERYEINRSFYYQTENAEDIVPGKRGKRFFLRLSLALVLLAALVAVSAYIFYNYRTHLSKAADNAPTIPESVVKNKSVDPVPPAEAQSAPAKKAPAPAPARLSLKVDAITETMIKIGMDDEDLVAYLLNPKDHIELEASRRFRLEVSNPDGVKVLLNDKPVTINGKNGEIVTLELTHPK